MKFSFVPRINHGTSHSETPTFTIARLWEDDPEEFEPAIGTEISGSFDRSYQYQSEQELRWHLAERFGVPADEVRLSRL